MSSSIYVFDLPPLLKPSLKKCQADNRSLQEEKEAADKRRKAAEEAKVNRSMRSAETEKTGEDNAVLDNLLEKLRKGDSVGRKSRKNRRANGKSSVAAQTKEVDAEASTVSALPPLPEGADKTVDLARDMLAALKSDGFETFSSTSSTPRPARSARRARQRTRGFSEFGEPSPLSPSFSVLSDGRDFSDVDSDALDDRRTPSGGSVVLPDEIESVDTSEENPDATIRGR